MKNALLYKVNMLFAYLTVSSPLSIDTKIKLLGLQTKVNNLFDYDWSSAK